MGVGSVILLIVLLKVGEDGKQWRWLTFPIPFLL